MPSRPLTPEQAADARRLKALFEQWRRGKGKQAEQRSYDEIAESIGYKQSAFSQRLNGTMALNAESAARFAKLIGKPVSAFSPHLAAQIEEQAEAINAAPRRAAAGPGKVLVRRIVGAHLSAGSGEVIYDFEEVADRSFDRAWMQERGLQSEHCVLWPTRGDSMYPTIEHGELVLVNLREREPLDRKVFVLITEDGLRLKRLIRRSDNTWEIRSDNEDKRLYPTEPYVEGAVAIMGRVRWHAGEM